MISIDWGTRVISVPKTDLTPLGGVLYGLDVDTFRLALKDLEDSDDGMAFPDTHRHNTSITLSGVTYTRFVEIINGYTVEFEDGQYTVVCSGANHNLADVKVPNQVSLIVGNAAGLITVSSGSGLSVPEHDKLMALPELNDIEGSDVLTRILGLNQENFRLKDQVYDGDGNLTSATVRIYASAADAGNDVTPIAAYMMTASFSGPGQCTGYLMQRTA